MLTGRDITKARVNYDESRDIGRMDRDATSLFFFAALLLIVLAVFYATNLIGAEDVAPTAAEVSAPGFDLEAKVAEVQP